MIIYRLAVYDTWDTDGDSGFTSGYFLTKEKAESEAKKELKQHETYFGKYSYYIEEITVK